MIRDISARPFITDNQHAYGVYLNATLMDGRIMQVPIIWTPRDYMQDSGSASSVMIQQLIENGINALMDLCERLTARPYPEEGLI